MTCLRWIALAAALVVAPRAQANTGSDSWYLHDDQIGAHVIAAAPNGHPLRPRIHANGSDFKAEINERHPIEPNAYREYLDTLVKTLRDSKPRKILIFIHGGMNLPGGALRRSAILGADPTLNEEYYPIFINWNSGPLSTYGEHLFLVRQGQRAPVFGALTSPFYLASDLTRALVRAPVVWVKLLQDQFDPYERRRATFSQESWRYLKQNPGPGHPKNPDLTTTDLQESDKRSRVQLTTNELHSLSLVLKAPAEIILDAIGTGAWEMMLRRSRQLFDSPTRFKEQKPRDRQGINEVVRLARAQPRGEPRTQQELDRIDAQLKGLYEGEGENRAEVSVSTAPRKKRNVDYLVRSDAGAVETFLTRLEQEVGRDPRRKYSITLIGHSMGAIVANEILLRHPRLPVDNIVYLAAACSVKESEDAVIPYLRQNIAAQFYSLSLHPIAEISETFMSPEREHPSVIDYSKATVGLLVPRGSLLQWLDAFFTQPLNLEDRRLGKWSTSISSAGIFPSDVSNRIHLTMFPVGVSNLPQKHGQFASESFPTRFWQKEFWQPNATPEMKAPLPQQQMSMQFH
ncbi:MAG: alpha/beta hydrolase [Verrucomicrobiota bacterium]